VRTTELAWLHEGLGPSTADAVVERTEDWYDTLFVTPGLVATSYRITVPNEDAVQRAGALAPLATLPLWSWVEGRLDVIWAAFYQALQRLAMLAAWWPFLLLLLVAAWGDGRVRRRIRQSGFCHASPLAHAYGLRGIAILLALVGLILFLPLPLPALGVPWVGVLLALLVSLTVANAPTRL